MDWLITIGKGKLGAGNASAKKPSGEDTNSKAYLAEKYRGQLLDRVAKDELQATVPAPPGVDINEWLATNTLSFFSHINLLYTSLSDYCTPSSCNTVTAGAPMQFTWVDDKGKKIRMTAPQYIELVIINVQKYVTDESNFPTKFDQTFPTNFLTVVKRIFRLLFHVFGHIYQSHFHHVVELGELTHMNTVFMHFMYFQSEHGLLEAKEVQPLDDLIKAFDL